MKTGKTCSSIAFFLLIMSLLVSAIDFCCFQKSFYKQEYQKDQTAEKIGMSDEDLMASTNALLDYLRDERDDIVVNVTVSGFEQEVFNERETLHMIDVKVLYQRAVNVRNEAFLIGMALLIFSLIKSKSHYSALLKRGYKNGMMAVGALIVFIAVAALADFDAFWTSFHKLFFTNDLWLLDPNTSIMINMFPDVFFFDLVMRIIIIFAVISLVTGIAIYQPFRKRVTA